MNHSKNINYVLRGLLFLTMLFLAAAVPACEPAPEISFDNQQNHEIRIFIAHVRDDGNIDKFVELGTVPVHATQTFSITFLGDEWVNRIEIRDTLGNVVLSHDYKMADLEKIGWKITIPP